MCLLDMFWGIGGGWWTVEMACTCLGEFWLGGSNAEKWSDHRQKNFYINNFIGLFMRRSDRNC